DAMLIDAMLIDAMLIDTAFIDRGFPDLARIPDCHDLGVIGHYSSQRLRPSHRVGSSRAGGRRWPRHAARTPGASPGTPAMPPARRARRSAPPAALSRSCRGSRTPLVPAGSPAAPEPVHGV